MKYETLAPIFLNKEEQWHKCRIKEAIWEIESQAANTQQEQGRWKLRVPGGPAHHRLALLEPCCSANSNLSLEILLQSL